MSYNYIIRFLRMLIILVVQILLLNNVHILGYITPLLLGYMILPFNKGADRIEMLLWGFVTGLLFDVFSNTAGMGAASLTLLAMLQPGLINLFTPRDAAEDFTPSFRVMGFWKYVTYCLMGMFIVHATFYALDAFTIANWQLTLSAIAIGTLIATLLCIVAELITKTKQ